jgi:lysophospholipase L1-like esterase
MKHYSSKKNKFANRFASKGHGVQASAWLKYFGLACICLLNFFIFETGIIGAPLRIAIASDSTAAYFPPTDAGKRWGWGQILTNFFSTNVVVNDLAESGRSSKSFYEEAPLSGWTKCLATHADYYFIQFGHNDGKSLDAKRYTDPETTFKQYLNLYVMQARAANGIPVFLTPPTRRSFAAEHTLKLDDLQNYAKAMREFAASNNVPVLDLLPLTIDFYEFIGKTQAPIYQADVVGPPFATNADGTHFSPVGARQHCCAVIKALLLSTNTSLAPLQAEIRHASIPLEAIAESHILAHLKDSIDLANDHPFGKTNVYPASTIHR